MVDKKRQEVLARTSQAHRDSLQKNLQHRLEVARAKGDETLIRMLEAEANYIS